MKNINFTLYLRYILVFAFLILYIAFPSYQNEIGKSFLYIMVPFSAYLFFYEKRNAKEYRFKALWVSLAIFVFLVLGYFLI